MTGETLPERGVSTCTKVSYGVALTVGFMAGGTALYLTAGIEAAAIAAASIAALDAADWRLNHERHSGVTALMSGVGLGGLIIWMPLSDVVSPAAACGVLVASSLLFIGSSWLQTDNDEDNPEGPTTEQAGVEVT